MTCQFLYFYHPFQIFTFRRQAESHNLLNTTTSQKRAQICFAEIVLVSALEGLDHPKELILRIQLLSTSPCALWEAPPESKHRSALKCSHLSWTDPQKCWPCSVLHFSACCPARKFEAFPAAASRLFLSGLNFGALPAKFVSASKSE